MGATKSERSESKYCVYFHIKPKSKQIFYVGIGNNKRPYNYKYRSTFWQNTVIKYGIEVKIVKEYLTWDEAQKFEKYFINQIGRRDLGKGNLVNLTDGGDGIPGIVINEGTSIKMSLSNIKRNNPDILEQKITEITSRAIYQYDLKGNFIKEWDTLGKICEILKIDNSSIVAVLNNRCISAKGFYWRRKYEIKDINIKISIPRKWESFNKKICQFDKHLNLIKEWDSISDASTYFGINSSQLSRAAKETSRTCKGFLWAYQKEISLKLLKWEKLYKNGEKIYINKGKQIDQFDINGNFLKKWNNAFEAARYYNLASTNITRAVRNNKISANSKWKYSQI